MSGCPEKDLHSIYLDGEMPEKFAKEYEAHLETCPKCREALEKLRKISQSFREDAVSCRLDNIYLEQSFERLQTKLQYAKNTRSRPNVFAFPAKWVVPAAAAAAVFAVVFAPIHLKTAPAANHEVTAIARTEIKPVTENKVVVDGNIDANRIASALSSSSTEQSAEEKETAINQNQKVVSATSLVSNAAAIDVFRPDFNKSPASVRIDVPDMHTIPMNQAGSFESR